MLLSKWVRQSSINTLKSHDGCNMTMSVHDDHTVILYCNDCGDDIVKNVLVEGSAAPETQSTQCERCHNADPEVNSKLCIDCMEAVAE